MPEAEKQGAVHHFSSERGPALIRAAGINQEIDAGTRKNNVPASVDSPASPPPSKGKGRFPAARVGSDAWNKKSSAHASTSELELMHETEK